MMFRKHPLHIGERVRIILADYRDLPSGMPYDKIVSVGMFEHVGRPRLPEYFSVAHRLLKCQIFLATKQKQVADRRLVVGAREDRVFGDFDVASNP